MALAPDVPWPVCDKWLGSDWMSGAIHTHTTGISHRQYFSYTWKMLRRRDKTFIYLEGNIDCFHYPKWDIGVFIPLMMSRTIVTVTGHSRWIEAQPFGGQNGISNLEQSQTIQLRRAGLKHWDISIYVSTTKTFICIKYFFLFEPLNFRRVTFMSKIFWKIFHAFFLQGEILFLKISKVIFLSLHFLYPQDICSSGWVLSVIMRLEADRFSSLGCDQTSSWSSLWLSDTIMIHAVFNQHQPEYLLTLASLLQVTGRGLLSEAVSLGQV